MKKIFLIVFAIVAFVGQMDAQMFDWKTSDSLQSDATLGSAYMQLFMENNTGDSLLLDWKLLENSFPSEWDAALCDYTACYVGVPDSGSMTTLFDLEDAFLSLTVLTNGHSGNGIMRFYVYNELNPTDGDTATFILNSLYNGISDYGINHGTIEIFPNPTIDAFTIQSDLNYPSEIWITDIHGKVYLNENLSANHKDSFDVSTFPVGIYLVKILDQKNNISISKLIKN